LLRLRRLGGPSAAFDVRSPKPQAYLFDVQLMLDGGMLIGGLHRDGYALVLTGAEDAAREVAAWYRSLFAPDQLLFLYEWAGTASPIELETQDDASDTWDEW
jgi:hypothetical protein